MNKEEFLQHSLDVLSAVDRDPEHQPNRPTILERLEDGADALARLCAKHLLNAWRTIARRTRVAFRPPVDHTEATADHQPPLTQQVEST